MEIENLTEEKMPVTRKRREYLVPLAEGVNHSHTLSPAMQTLHRRRRINSAAAAAAAAKGPATKITRGVLLGVYQLYSSSYSCGRDADVDGLQKFRISFMVKPLKNLC